MAQNTSSSTGSLPHFRTGGTFYDFGFNVGAHFRERIRLFFNESEQHQNTVIPFYDSHDGRQFFEENLRVCQDCFPQYVREVRGLGDGAGLPFEQVFMANVCEHDMEALLKPESVSQTGQQIAAGDPEFGCSSLFISCADTKLILHTEDQPPLVKKHGYMVSADISEEGHKEKFTSYCCPGLLPGLAFNVNHQGIVFTSNALRPAKLQRGSPSRTFLTRALLSSGTIEEAVKQTRNEPYGSAYGFTANLSNREGDMVSLEIGPGKPQAAVHVQQVSRPSGPDSSTEPCHYYHFNTYQHLKVAETGSAMSSARRAQRVKELPLPRRLEEALAIMADTKDQEYPIFRTPRPTDPAVTACTVVFDILANDIRVYEDREGLLSNTPALRFPVWGGDVV